MSRTRASFDYAPLDTDSPLPSNLQSSPRRSSKRSHPVRAWLSTRTGVCSAALAVTVVVAGALAMTTSPSSSSRGPSSGTWAQRVMGTKTSQDFDSLRTDHTYAYGTPEPNEIDAYAEHPIRGLIREAKSQWADKVARQSTSYEGAVKVYKERHHRDPPPGFKEWYDYAKEHDVQLIDEYDSLYAQVELLLALPPSVLEERLHAYDDKEGRGRDHGLITVKDHVITVGESWRPPVMDGFAELMQPVAHLIPDMVIPLYLHDAASVTLDYRAMEGYRRAARENRWVDEKELPIELEHESVWTKRERQCPADSPYRRLVTGLDTRPPPAGPAFIRNHRSAMDFCMAPQLVDIHGSLASTADIQMLRPSISLSSLDHNSDLVWPSTIQYDLNPKNESPFREKSHKLLWRGSPDGVSCTHDKLWRQSHRFRLLALLNSNDTAPRIVRETRYDHLGREYQVDVAHTLAELNARYSNVRATGGPVQCSPDICEHIKDIVTFVPKSPLEDMADNRYVMDVDGNAYSARFRAHLQSNQVPFKSTIFPGWFMDRIQPWVHYVPVRVDYSDLYDVLAFFDGGVDAARSGNHDDLAEEIAHAGADWARKHWRIEDMRVYTLRLLLEWARAFDPARESNRAPQTV